MAYIVDEEDKQQEEGPQAGQAGAVNQGQILSGPSGGVIGGGGQAATSTTGASPKGTSSGSFTNLKAYIGANAGNDASMGQAVGNTIGGHSTKADEAGGAFKATASDAIAANTVTDSDGITDAFKSLADPIAGGDATPARSLAVSGTEPTKSRTPLLASTEPAKSPVRAPVAATTSTSTPRLGDVSSDSFNQLYNASYQGPTRDSLVNVGGYGDTAAAYDKVGNLAGMATGAKADMSSRGQLLDETYAKGGKQYRGGERTLDSFILGSGEQGLAELEKAGQQYGDYGNQFSGILDMLGGQAQTAAADTDATRTAFRDAVSQAQTGLTGRLDAAQTAADTANQDYDARFDKLAAGDREEWNQFDLTKFAGDSGYSQDQLLSMLKNGVEGMSGVDLNKLLVKPDGRQTMANFADDGDEGDYQQLMAMIGGAGGDGTSKYGTDSFKNGNLGNFSLNENRVNKYLSPLIAEAQRLGAFNTSFVENQGDGAGWGGQNPGGQTASSEAEDMMASLGTTVPGQVTQSSKMKALLDAFKQPIKSKDKDQSALYSSSTGVKSGR